MPLQAETSTLSAMRLALRDVFALSLPMAPLRKVSSALLPFSFT